MTDADPPDDRPRTAADPTMRVARPPVPGRAVRADLAAGHLTAPPVREDDPTVALDHQARKPPHRTLQFGRPAPVTVTVGPRPRPRRRFRTWPWIAAVGPFYVGDMRAAVAESSVAPASIRSPEAAVA